MPPCEFCAQPSKLIKAHVIPAAFFRTLLAQGEIPRLLSATDYPRRRPAGVYDEETLCEDCEKLFLDLDTYAADVLLGGFEDRFAPLQVNGDIVAFEAEGMDQYLLLRFLVSVLWRASVSKQPFYSKVKLGPHSASAKATIVCSDIGHLLNFSAVLSRWKLPSEQAIATFGFLSPFSERWEGANAYRLHLGPLVAYIRVDRRQLPSSMEDISLTRNAKLLVLAQEFEGSSDYRAFVKLAHSARRKQ